MNIANEIFVGENMNIIINGKIKKKNEIIDIISQF